MEMILQKKKICCRCSDQPTGGQGTDGPRVKEMRGLFYGDELLTW